MDRVRQRLDDLPWRLIMGAPNTDTTTTVDYESNNHNEIEVQTEFSRLQQKLQMQSPSFRGSLVTGQTKNRNSVNECLFVWLVVCLVGWLLSELCGFFYIFSGKVKSGLLNEGKSLQTSTFIALHISPFENGLDS